VAFAGCFPVLLVTAAAVGLFEVAAREGGWLPSTLAFIVPLLALATGLGLGRRWWQRAALVLVIALALGASIYRMSPPAPERLAAAARDVGVPPGWQTVDEQVGGSTWGLFGDFPRYDAEYATTDPTRSAMQRYAALLEADGWERYDPHLGYQPPAELLKTFWRSDRWLLSVTVRAPHSRGREYDGAVPPRLTEVDVHVGYS
jgi:hypothetical protein